MLESSCAGCAGLPRLGTNGTALPALFGCICCAVVVHVHGTPYHPGAFIHLERFFEFFFRPFFYFCFRPSQHESLGFKICSELLND